MPVSIVPVSVPVSYVTTVASLTLYVMSPSSMSSSVPLIWSSTVPPAVKVAVELSPVPSFVTATSLDEPAKSRKIPSSVFAVTVRANSVADDSSASPESLKYLSSNASSTRHVMVELQYVVRLPLPSYEARQRSPSVVLQLLRDR